MYNVIYKDKDIMGVAYSGKCLSLACKYYKIFMERCEKVTLTYKDRVIPNEFDDLKAIWKCKCEGCTSKLRRLH